MPAFVANDAALMLAELLLFQERAMQQGVVDQSAYADAYADVFTRHEPVHWLTAPPAEIAHGIVEIIRTVGLFVLLDDAVALDVLFRESAWEAVLPPVRTARPGPIYTPSRQQQLENRAAFEALVHRAAAMTFAERLPSVPIDSLAQGEELYRTVGIMFDAVIDEASERNDGTVRTLRKIKSSAWALIDSRALSAQEEAIIEFRQPMPSLVVAHFSYREARQAQRIRDANPTAHPNFMPRRLVVPPWP